MYTAMFLILGVLLYLKYGLAPGVVTKTYSRSKAAPTNSTGLVSELQVGEKPGTPVVLDYADAAAVTAAAANILAAKGTTGNFIGYFVVDVDESGGTSKKQMFKYEIDVAINGSGDGSKATATCTITPVLGDASLGSPKTVACEHPETLDTFQTNAGRVRQ